MKTLRKGEEFKRVKNSSQKDYAAIQKLRAAGWEFCDKTTWRRLADMKKGDKDE